MSRLASAGAVDKVLDATDGGPRVGGDMRSKNVQGLSRAARVRGGKLRFVYHRKLRVALPAFIAGFVTCAWMGLVKKPPVVKKVVRKKKPPPRSGPIIEELPDDAPVPSMSAVNPGEETKLVLVVNDSLNMGAGKIAAQCCHATLAVYQSLGPNHRAVLRRWESEGQKKIALKVRSATELRQLATAAKAARLPHFIVEDAGRTQVAAGSCTVIAIGPAPESAVNAVTGALRLL